MQTGICAIETVVKAALEDSNFSSVILINLEEAKKQVSSPEFTRELVNKLVKKNMNTYEFLVIPFPNAGRFCVENDRLQFLYEKFQKQYEKAPHLKFPQRLQVYI
ncbi:MAG: hypothetical protein KBG30_12275, partial [Bacteroidales bacterium]|nr:hypothetical protein [Bacteroidales bacterium]